MHSRLLLLLLLLTPMAHAALPAHDAGVLAGLALHRSHLQESDDRYTSFGLSFGADYQYPLADNIAVNFFVASSSEGASGDLSSGSTTGHGFLGVGARYFFPAWFAGVQLGQYSEAVLHNDSGTRDSGNGFGLGVSAGMALTEQWLLIGQYDMASNIDLMGDTLELIGLRVNVSYRWKIR